MRGNRGGREAATSWSVSVRVVFFEVSGIVVVVTPSARLRLRRMVTTALRRAMGLGWQKKLKERAPGAWKVAESNGGGGETRDAWDLLLEG